MRRFTASSTSKLDAPIQNLISEELESIIISISDFFNCSSPPGDREQYHWDLHRDIQTQLSRIETSEEAGDHTHDQIQKLIQEIQQIHLRLQQRLSFAVTKFPRDLTTRNSASNDLLAMTIEASLVKVSLIRAQALKTMYNYHAPRKPELHMKRALTAAYAKLKEEERQMEEEEGELDRELSEYQTLIDMFDGGSSGGFKQIVVDCARVEKETEECRKDLRRLGWTGEN
ncbi:hypothetical protein DFH09DRAFT_1137605 [Mycena vulgaris]|nr:hypothetical protein DFH09DRAFT_1137605 [Mycena vulgaris]